MKIALAHKRLDFTGGTERDFYRTAEGLRNLGHEVHLAFTALGGWSRRFARTLAPNGDEVAIAGVLYPLALPFRGPVGLVPDGCR